VSRWLDRYDSLSTWYKIRNRAIPRWSDVTNYSSATATRNQFRVGIHANLLVTTRHRLGWDVQTEKAPTDAVEGLETDSSISRTAFLHSAAMG